MYIIEWMELQGLLFDCPMAAWALFWRIPDGKRPLTSRACKKCRQIVVVS